MYGCSYAAAARAWVHLSESCWRRSSTANSVPVTATSPQLIAGQIIALSSEELSYICQKIVLSSGGSSFALKCHRLCQGTSIRNNKRNFGSSSTSFAYLVLFISQFNVGHCTLQWMLVMRHARLMLCCGRVWWRRKCLIKSNIWLKSQINYNFQIGS